jgi:hypothetical protein
MWAFEATEPEQLPIVPTAGHFYSVRGALAPNEPALAALRARTGLGPGAVAAAAAAAPAPAGPTPAAASSAAGAASALSSVPPAPALAALARAALLWLHPRRFAPLAEDAVPLRARQR